MRDEVYTQKDGARLDIEKASEDGYRSLREEIPPRDTEVLLMTERGWRLGMHDNVTWMDTVTGEEIHEPEIYAWRWLRHVNDYLAFTCQRNKCRRHVPGDEVNFSKGVGAVCQHCWRKLGYR
jgi:hypothetical protein